MSRKTNIFTIYAWEDKNVMLQIMHYLRPYEESGSVNIWNDEPIIPGKEWKPQIDSRIEYTDIFLLLVSSDFMKSKFIQQIEFKNVIDRYKANKSIVIPVLVDDCEWYIDFKSEEYNFNFNELQVLPEQKNPIENWKLPEEAFDNIGVNIVKSIAALRGENIEKEIIKEETAAAKIATKVVDDQLQLGFFDEVEDNKTDLLAQDRKAEELRLVAEAEAIRKALEKQHLEEDAIAAKQQAEEEQRLQEELVAKKKVEEEVEEQKLLAAAETQRKELEAQRLEEEALTSQKQAEKDQRLQEELVAKQKVEEEEQKLLTAAETQRKVLEAKRIEVAAIAAKRQAEKEQRLQEEVVAKQKVEEEQKLLVTAEAQRKELESQRVQEEAVAIQKQAEEEQRLLAKAEAERKVHKERQLEEVAAKQQQAEEDANQQLEEEQRLLEEAEASKAYQEHDMHVEQDYEDELEEVSQEYNKTTSRKGLLIIAAIVLIAASIYTFSKFNKEGESQSPLIPENNEVVVEEPIITGDILEETETEIVSEEKTAATVADNDKLFSELKVGDQYAGGIVFSISQAKKTGKIAQINDAGPMTWKNAMKIDEQLGVDWRLPSQDELKIMYKTIGKGASNSGHFTDELYWSSTIYRKIQSRLVRFSDGNASFHYSNVRVNRKFRVRAIRDINE